MNDKQAPIVLLPCNGLSARGRIAYHAAAHIEEGLEDLQRVDLVPLLAGLSEETTTLRQARFVLALAGCEHRCDLGACEKILGRRPDDAFVIGDLVRPEVCEEAELSPDELQNYILEVASRVLGKLSQI